MPPTKVRDDYKPRYHPSYGTIIPSLYCVGLRGDFHLPPHQRCLSSGRAAFASARTASQRISVRMLRGATVLVTVSYSVTMTFYSPNREKSRGAREFGDLQRSSAIWHRHITPCTYSVHLQSIRSNGYTAFT